MTLQERFDSFVQKSDTCWLWTGTCRSGRGYAQLWRNGKVQRASRIAYELYKGPVPGGLCVCHTCDNPGCVNPSHLFLATHSQNMKDAVLKKRHNNARKTHWPRIHTREHVYKSLQRLGKPSLPHLSGSVGATVKEGG